MDCALPPDLEVPNSHYTVRGEESDSEGWYLPGAVLEYTCDTGYIMQGGVSTRQCQSGLWVGEKPQCVEQASCDDPGWPVNSQRCCQYIFYVGVKLSFYCNEGYNISGSDERTCLSNGQWSGVQPVCNEITVPPTPEDSSMFNTETLTIVMATTGSILGILVVTVILTSRQCRSRRHLVPQTYPPVLRAQLARLHRDPDALALLAVTDDIGVVLPSYDEAVAQIQTAHVPPFQAPSTEGDDSNANDGGENRSSVQGRPLPPIPPPLPHQGSSTRSGRSRRQRRAGRQQTHPSPSPPAYEQHEEPLDVADAVQGESPPAEDSQARRGEEEVMEGGGPTHSMVGNDLYAEVPQRRAEPQGDDAHHTNDNTNQEES
ncbi:uncharacterized protein LOC121418832 [Lytechinus variegatus]|uniref:uncharacterized protein LOC121418832 n=1 Tax=Lytechinus variegatus TaxID=7654 RepID=UPI001BB29373|nr:uncharacterized protein LOC121418832 [Lytechinus variegatus]